MKYPHILMAVTDEFWALREEKLLAILEFLSVQASGVKFSAEEIEARISNGRAQAVARQEGAVAILPLRGVIANRMSLMGDISGGASAEGLSRMFKSARGDQGIKAIILDVDSDGGAVSGSDELSSEIYAARGDKPIIAHVNATAASAAYWIASAADEVVVTPSGSVGSIGVFGTHSDLSGALDKAGIRKTLISAGKYKVEGNPLGPLSDDARDRIQARVDAAYDRFVRTVARNRNVTVSAVRDGFGQGGMVDAAAALAEGMIDRIATLDETLQRFGAGGDAVPPKRRALAPERQRRAAYL